MVIAGILIFFYVLGVAACANMIGVWRGISYAQKTRDVERVPRDGISACFLSLIWPVIVIVGVLAFACNTFTHRNHEYVQYDYRAPDGGQSKPDPRARPAARDVPSRPPVIREGEDGQWFLNEEEGL